MAEITLTAAVRANLLSLQRTDGLISKTQVRLATGLKVSSALDDPKAFFEAKALNDRASDFGDLKDGIDQAISSIKVALDGTESIDDLVRQLKGIAISAKSATGTELAALVAQYNSLRTQIDNLARDAEYQGLNLVNGTGATLTVEFGKSSLSVLTISSVDIRSSSLGLNIASAASFSLASLVDAAITGLDTALTTLRGQASSLGSNVALLQTRLTFTNSYVNALDEGASKLTLADINEEGANLVALQTRQQLGIAALSFAGQAEQSVLQLFR